MTTPHFINADRELGASYPVSLPAFEGPLDLLLHLIERRELEISQISLMAVTEAYLQTLAQLEEIEPGALADFLVIASRLLFIKSRNLLPKPATKDEEEEEDPGDALIRQLIEYRQFKEVANQLKARAEAGLRVYVRSAPGPQLDKRLDLGGVDLTLLHKAVQKALQRMPSDPPMPRVHTYPITVAEQIENVRNYIRDAQRLMRAQLREMPTAPVSFTELLSQSATRMEVIVTFLAVLELIKQRELLAEQDGTFGEIVLTPVGLAVENGDGEAA
ncbi:MAG: segregation/condensation protein A [Caldilineaceae bacterium]